MILDHLLKLSYPITKTEEPVWAVAIYEENGKVSDAEGEGRACVDDTARAVLLALELYEAGNQYAWLYAKRWMNFIEYMWTEAEDQSGFANFIYSDGTKNLDGKTSTIGGDWWSVRARWALTRMIRVIGEKITRDIEFFKTRHNLDESSDLFFRHYIQRKEEYITRLKTLLENVDKVWFPNGSGPKIHALYILSQLELNPKILPFLPELTFNGEYLDVGDSSFFAFHQLLAAAILIHYDERHLDWCEKTVENLIEPIIKERMGYGLDSRFQHGICAYCVSPIVQGLGELYRVTDNDKYAELALEADNWFYGRNDAGKSLYSPLTGRCFDGLQGSTINYNCSAESALESGFSYLERQRLLKGL